MESWSLQMHEEEQSAHAEQENLITRAQEIKINTRVNKTSQWLTRSSQKVVYKITNLNPAYT